jgi:phenylpropionate dioxygenase-like ring-hydroxylating dioxygenase large terminal subunit
MTTLFQQIAETCAAPSAAEALTLPPAAYGSQELFELETERVFKAGWLPLCRVEQIAEPNSYYSVDMLGLPLVVTRDRHSEIHVLSRSCRHRWMDVCSGSGTAKSLQCPYHLWSYGMDGHLGGAPEMAGSKDFKREDYSLRTYRHEVWQGFICVNIDGQASSLNEQLAGLTKVVEPYQLSTYTTVSTSEWECPWDWKVMVDNFMECYHHLGPHRETLEAEWPARNSWVDDGGDYYSVMWGEQAPGYPPTSDLVRPTLDEKYYRKGLMFIAYPLLQMSAGVDSMYWLQSMPLGPGRMKLQLHITMSPEAMATDDFEERKANIVERITEIHREDIDACTRVQAAIDSGAADVGRLSILEKALYEFYQFLGRELDIDSLLAPHGVSQMVARAV